MGSLRQAALSSASLPYWPLPSSAGDIGGSGTPRHSATKTRWVLPLAATAALLAAHSSRHCLKVFCCATTGGDHASTATSAALATKPNCVLIISSPDNCACTTGDQTARIGPTSRGLIRVSSMFFFCSSLVKHFPAAPCRTSKKRRRSRAPPFLFRIERTVVGATQCVALVPREGRGMRGTPKNAQRFLGTPAR